MIISYIRFGNGIQIPTIGVYGRKEFFNGTKRDVMDIRIDPKEVNNYDMNDIILTYGNIDNIVLGQAIYDDIEPNVIKDTSEYEHKGYVLIKSKGIDTVDDMFCYRIVLARLTDDEMTIQELEKQLSAQTLEIATLATKI